MNFLKRLVKEEEGQGLIEYVLIVGLIALVAVGAIQLAGGSINTIWGKVTDALSGIATPKTPETPVTPVTP